MIDGNQKDGLVERILSTVHTSWRDILADAGCDLPGMAERTVDRIATGERVLPSPEHIFRALNQPEREAKVLILGQDPYPTAGHAVGFSFAAEPHTRPLPKSLQNIFAEYESDLGLPRPVSADLSPWTRSGVLLLNRVLTVQEGAPASHRHSGWEEITGAVVSHLATRPMAAVLWGRQAQEVAPLVGKQRCVLSAHPSPLSAYRGFFGSKPFSTANEILRSQGVEPVNWSLADQEVVS